MIHLPVRLASQTHKFPKKTHIFSPAWVHLDANNYDYVLSLEVMQIRIKFAIIHIWIIRAVFPIKQENCAVLAIKQVPFDPKSKNSKEIGYFKEVFPLKQRQKHASSFSVTF